MATIIKGFPPCQMLVDLDMFGVKKKNFLSERQLRVYAKVPRCGEYMTFLFMPSVLPGCGEYMTLLFMPSVAVAERSLSI